MNFLSRKAHVFNTLKTCEALSCQNDVRLRVITTTPKVELSRFKSEVLEYVGIEKEIDIIWLYSPLAKYIYSKSRSLRLLSLLTDNFIFCLYLLMHRQSFDTIYSRDHLLFLTELFNRIFLRKKFIFEAHYILSNRLSQFFVNQAVKVASGVITITYSLATIYKNLYKKNITLFCAASEPDRFDHTTSKSNLRAELGLPQDKKLVGYTGNLYLTGNNDSYGVEDVIRALPFLDEDIIFVGVGKKDSNNMEHENLAKLLGVSDRVLILPWATKALIPKYIQSFDVLVIPKSGNKPGNSPTKIFEYLPSFRPIVAARTEAISEVLKDGYNALLVDFENPKAWADSIKTALGTEAHNIINGAHTDSYKYTWQNRAKDIIGFIKSL